jgi:hypothetical protein
MLAFAAGDTEAVLIVASWAKHNLSVMQMPAELFDKLSTQ